MTGSTTVPGAPTFARERRLTPRMRVNGALRIDLRRSGQPVPVEDVSLSGFAIASPEPLEPGTVHYCALEAKYASPVTVLSQVVRSDRARGSSHYVIGFRFSMMEADIRQQLNQVIEAAARRQHLRLSGE